MSILRKSILIVFGFLIMLLEMTVVNNANDSSEPHPCKRECNGTRMTCKYHFRVEIYYILDAMACYQCPNVTNDCYRPDCIVAGGYRKNIITVNRQIPGPSIEVCQFDKIEVLLENLIFNDETTSVHWHGQIMQNTQYMNGVPFITQCPIMSNNNFTYKFYGTQSGTHFWHSHDKIQKGDGMFGMVVVNVPKEEDPHSNLYDKDLKEHQIAITDWTIKTRNEKYGETLFLGKMPLPDGILINGQGYIDMINVDLRIPIANFIVEKGLRYRFRFVNTEFLDCPFKLTSFDKHNMTIISADGNEIVPQIVTSFNIFTGEGYDVIIEANQPSDAYWMRVKGLANCAFNKNYQVGILRYLYSNNTRPATEFPTYETAAPNTGLHLSTYPLNNNTDIIDYTNLKAYYPMPEYLNASDVMKIYIKVSLNFINNPISFRYPFYGYREVAPTLHTPTPVINDIVLKTPPVPLHPNRFEFTDSDFCSNETEYRKNCTVDFCECLHLIQIPKNQVVELIIYDTGKKGAHHAMHLHGNYFYTVAWQISRQVLSRDDIEFMDENGMIERNLKNAILKDTVPVPAGGFTIVRFKASNIGYWLFHCHVDTHSEEGMRMILKIGKDKHMPPVPKQFPECRGFQNTDS